MLGGSISTGTATVLCLKSMTRWKTAPSSNAGVYFCTKSTSKKVAIGVWVMCAVCCNVGVVACAATGGAVTLEPFSVITSHVIMSVSSGYSSLVHVQLV